MLSNNNDQKEVCCVEIVLPVESFAVSYFSNLLRVIQAAIRELASTFESLKEISDENLRSVLHFTPFTKNGELVLQFSFLHLERDVEMEEFTSIIAPVFFDELLTYLRGNAQTDLWGNISPVENLTLSDSMKGRFDRVRKELRRIPGASIGVNNRTIVFSENTFKVI